MGWFSDSLKTLDPIYSLDKLASAIGEGWQMADAVARLDLDEYEKHLQRGGQKFTSAHPGTDATVFLTEDQWDLGIAEAIPEISQGVSSIFGAVGGPIVGAIGGAAVSQGLGNQYGGREESNYDETDMRQNISASIVTGLVSGLLSDNPWGGTESVTEVEAGSGAATTTTVQKGNELNTAYNTYKPAVDYVGKGVEAYQQYKSSLPPEVAALAPQTQRVQGRPVMPTVEEQLPPSALIAPTSGPSTISEEELRNILLILLQSDPDFAG